MNNMINFPLNDLDVSKYVHFKQPGACYTYDLFGVVNHFGSMRNGHYTASVKNECTGEWLIYNDASCRPQTESKVHSSSAYILFYRRKDLTSMKKAIPTLNVTRFPGMPIHIKPGYLTAKALVGCLIEYREDHPCPFVVGLSSGAVCYLSAKAIGKDPDSEDLFLLNPRRRR
jgi:hypothetical protein